MPNANAVATGITSAMPMSLSTVRGSHLGNRRGHCSSHPNMNRMAQTDYQGAQHVEGQGCLAVQPGQQPKLAETIKVKRSRGQAKMRLKPLGTDAAVVAMA